MKAARVAAVLCLACLAAGTAEDSEVWGPADGVTALTAVEKALDKIISNPHLGKAQLEDARKVVVDVKKDVELVESGHNLTKAARNQKVKEAIGELMGLEKKWQVPSTKADALRAKMAAMKKELAEKQAELAKDETMIKLVKLQKELAEKKLQLQKLMEMKKGGKQEASAEEESRKEDNALIAKALAVTKTLKGKDEQSKPLEALLGEVKTRSHKISEAIDKMDAEDKKNKNEVEATLKQNKGGREGKKEAAMLKMLEKETHRKYAKARALKKAELADLARAQKSIVERDAKGLEKVLGQMQSETKALTAKSGNFLY